MYKEYGLINVESKTNRFLFSGILRVCIGRTQKPPIEIKICIFIMINVYAENLLRASKRSDKCDVKRVRLIS